MTVEATRSDPQDNKQPGISADTSDLEALVQDLAHKLPSVQVVPGKKLPLLDQFGKLKAYLQGVYQHYLQATRQTLVISYGGEWLLDNYYLVQQALQHVEKNMPWAYYRQLPKLETGPLKGYPRVYMLAHALSHVLHSRISMDEQSRFLQGVQAQTTLTIGELWAWPSILRIVILENLVMGLAAATKTQGQPAQQLVPGVVQVAYHQALDSDFIIANCISSLRSINAQNWAQFFEAHSRVERVLRQDPAGVYAHMDFETRDRYRSKIESLAQRSSLSEVEVAESVRRLAAQAPEQDAPAQSHVGYYLIDAGLPAAKRAIDYESSVGDRLREGLRRGRLPIYLGAIGLLTALIMALALHYAGLSGASLPQAVAVALLSAVPALMTASHLVNWMATQLVAPAVLPKLDFSTGIPAACRSVVVIPAMLSDEDEIDSLAQQLEQHYLRNEDPMLAYAILADYLDADAAHQPADEALAQQAQLRIEALNARYGDGHGGPFFFFLRQRLWNAAESKWMGYERKRGKLAEFNRWLLDPAAETSFIIQQGDLQRLQDIRYVITLDADSVLPRDAARRLVGSLAHPLNQARFDSQGSLQAGYTVLQPRIEILPVAANQTAFSRIFAGERGLDLYSLSVSDVYQDLFGQGIYVGKGIYDLAAFERSLHQRTPENALLSHDLFEGLHGRVGLVSDIVVLEDYPSHYLAHSSRVHRWVRGDWQLLPWLLPRVPSATGRRLPNVFSVLDRWKILDNLLRSLLHPALFFMILLSWLWLPGAPLVWTVFALWVLLVPFVLGVFNQAKSLPLVASLEDSQQRDLTLSLLRWALSVAFLPYEASIRLDAIRVTLYRLARRKHLLQWQTSASMGRLLRGARVNMLQQHMLPVVLVCLLLALVALWLRPLSLIVSLPLVATWLAGPRMAQAISQAASPSPAALAEDERRKLRSLARRTWHFFEEFVGPVDHWLPPDHYQQRPLDKVGHYTSPTNIGLMLLSVVAAYDMGYIGLLDMLTRLHFSFESLAQLERYQGHLLNWYNTKTLQALSPRYVSTVDNGNLAACLLVLRQAAEDIYHQPILRPQRWQGLLDTLDVIAQILEELDQGQAPTASPAVMQQVEAMRAHVLEAMQNPGHWIERLNRLADEDWRALSEAISALIDRLQQADAQQLQDLRLYLGRLLHHLSSIRRDIDLLLPWLPMIVEGPPPLNTGGEELESAWQRLLALCDQPPQVVSLQPHYEQMAALLKQISDLLPSDASAQQDWCRSLLDKLQAATATYHDLLAMARTALRQIDSEFEAMNFGFLYNEQRHLFHIGYNVDSEQLDNSFYDLLASEARLASFLAIAKNDVPQQHWLHLGRPVTHVDRLQTLLSWSGTMFEYLMPRLFMRAYPQSLLAQSYEAVVTHQMNYGRKHNLPWGISESGYYAFDSAKNYQYRAFGLPALGFKRSPEQEFVVAPYASILALAQRPKAVIDNLATLARQGALSGYGFVEAVDYSPSRLPLGRDQALVQEYMAHHQGMIFIALANYLQDDLMVRRFHSNPLVESVELLLMEQIPQQLSVEPEAEGDLETQVPAAAVSTQPWEMPIETPAPQAHLLSNGRYAVMISNAGSGYSQWGDRAITRWQADTTLDNWGQWLYLFDEARQRLWSPTRQPLGSGEFMKSTFHLGRVEYQSRAEDISSSLTVWVAPDDDVEIRKMSLTNHSDQARQISVCSYGEMVLAPQANDQRHPAFNKMFIESEILAEWDALLFWRRPRSDHDRPMWVLHMLVAPGQARQQTQFETDRRQFLGRNRSYRNPAAFDGARPQFTGSSGATLDPIMAIARSIHIPPHATVELAYVTLAADNRQDATALAQRYRLWDELERAANQSRYRSESELRNLGLNADAIARFQRLLSSLIYPGPALRAPAEVLAANRKAQPGLWAYGISGDYPITMVEISSEEQLELLHELVMAHRFWRNRGFASTLVILNQSDTGYLQELYNLIHRLLLRTDNANWLNRHDGIFILRADQLDEADRTLLRSAARVWLDAAAGDLQQQLAQRQSGAVTLPPLQPSLADADAPAPRLAEPDELLFDNGYGAFTAGGQEYLIRAQPPQHSTPSPWINVIANESAGFIISEVGSGFSWAYNSGEYRLSTWRNDPVSDLPAEALYLRDEETAAIWSPTPLPASSGQPCQVRHGAGYSRFIQHSHGLQQTTLFSLAAEEPVKLVRLHLKNSADRPRRITITYYMEWLLGPLRETSQQYLIPEFDTASQTLLAHNPYSMEFGQHYAFVTADKDLHGMTTDRGEFLGRYGDLAQPAALRRIGLGSQLRAGADPCAVLQLHVDLPVGGETEVSFIIGAAQDRASALALSQRYRSPQAVQEAIANAQAQWRRCLDSIVARTPDPAFNLLLPWLLYQSLSCRIWGRSALYQSSGAYGFRDQLQDVASLLHVRPDLCRAHLLRAARHQFEAGDVLHWWHPPSGRGVRTRFADDLVWLPLILSHYVRTTGDVALLEEEVPFLRGEALRPEEEERYGFYESTADSYPLYEHARRALKRAYELGVHGLPLMKAGDWNDGMNRVGIKGRGESVWMGWFLYTTLDRFLPLCQQRGDRQQAAEYRQWMQQLKTALEQAGWDGGWYRRAYYDDGTPLGAAQNQECRIDSLSQSWAVISGAAAPARAEAAMQAVAEQLLQWEDRLLLLFTPPFEHTPKDPGYIKGYPPGIRENGGQYTHAALWVVWAVAQMGQGELADQLFRLLNPIYHSDTADKAAHYRVEPYVIAADVYGAAPHTGRGGWTWYTGSAGWMYRLAVEMLLGLRREGTRLYVEPQGTPQWTHFELDYRYGDSIYHIKVERGAAAQQLEVDGLPLPDAAIPLLDDGQAHEVIVRVKD